MGDAKHTPGPWDVDEGDFSIYQLETGDQIAEMFGHQTPDEVEANARLMASAPDMLATIEALRAENARLTAENAALKKDIDEWEADWIFFFKEEHAAERKAMGETE